MNKKTLKQIYKDNGQRLPFKVKWFFSESNYIHNLRKQQIGNTFITLTFIKINIKDSIFGERTTEFIPLELEGLDHRGNGHIGFAEEPIYELISTRKLKVKLP